MPVRPGLEVFTADPPELVRDRRLGLVTTAAAVDRQFRIAIDLLAAPGVPWKLTRIFGPEHGVRGDIAAGGTVPDTVDSITGLPVSSLYGDTYKPTAAMLADVDVLVIDLQDVGVRFYTYNVTVANCLEAAAQHGRPVVILDRPNPIGGVAVEGPLLQAGYESFVGRRGQPIRHGLSYGELALAVNELEGIGATVQVVQAEGWSRANQWDVTGLPWIMPSPNIPTPDTAAVYPGTCLLEGTLLSEGRGTTRPFEIVGAPWIEPYRWAAALEERSLPGVRFRPLWFQPVSSKHAGQVCGGVQLHVTDRERFQPVAAGVHVIDTARRLWPQRFGWRAAVQTGAMPFIDRLYGSAVLREMIDGGADAAAVIATWNTVSFDALRQRVRLYR